VLEVVTSQSEQVLMLQCFCILSITSYCCIRVPVYAVCAGYDQPKGWSNTPSQLGSAFTGPSVSKPQGTAASYT
jgi:hypothetical protein